MNGGTTGAPRSRSKATGQLWTGSQTLKNPGAQSPDLSTETERVCWTSSWSDILSEHVNITNIHLVDPLNKVIAFDEVERKLNFVA